MVFHRQIAELSPAVAQRSGWIPSLSSLPGTVAREPWRLGLDSDGGVASDGLRALPKSGQFSVSQGPLEALCVCVHNKECYKE
jgi:hypothetical protein